ncbi:MAG: valyl-tRNA synthetase, partial [Paracoccaceae bacterium]
MAMEKTFNAAEAEDRLYKAWEDAGAFAAGKHVDNAETGTYSIMIPPPNVTGSLHMGHAFNNTLQDIMIRWHRMRGFDTLWQPGQDHAGIATQMVVERQLAEKGQKRTDFTREEFVDKIWEWKEESGDTIINQLKRLGSSCDWSRNAFTMSGNFPEAVTKVFVEMYNKGQIYRGKRLVNWDPHFETAISDLEVENIEMPGHMWHFKYPLAANPETGKPATYTYVEKDEDGNVTLTETRDYIAIATTRPETMLGDGAVAVHPSDERYASIVGMLCEIPVGPKEHRRLIPIITDDYPDKDFGSGAVKITGAHDFNDYEVAKRNKIPMYSLMDTRGNMRADGAPYADEATIAQRIVRGEEGFDEAKIAAMNLVPDEYRGMDRFEARKAVVADITAEGLAVMVPGPEDDSQETDEAPMIPYVENKPIMQPFGDRSKVVIEPMLTDQWFVDTAQIVQPAIDAVRNGDVKILPEQHEKVYFHWLENIEPWCISRQLWWGHQIPVWYGPGISEDGHVDYSASAEKAFCGATWEDVAAQARDFYGADEIHEKTDFTGALEDQLKSFSHDAKTISLWRDPDVLDTWFSSGLWPIGTLGWPEDTPELQKYFPTSTLITGFDIIFFWVARMMMMQYAVVDQKPFDTVYVHALVRDEKGKKMSKSLGNVLDPLDLIDEYGADAVRFTVTAMAAMGRDLKLSTQRIVGYRNFGTKLWNAMRFAEMNDVF